MANRWSKIDEAPKDGTAILVSCNGIAMVVVWVSVMFKGCNDNLGHWVLVGDDDCHDCGGPSQPEPQWWMPLPEPPPK